MTKDEADKLEIGTQVFIEGLQGLGYVDALHPDFIEVRWPSGLGLIYFDSCSVAHIGNLCKVGG
jgi:hypothetical protein